jgi:signal transduction histidine kinase
MLELTLSVSERERIQIAADLHDGPIQDLAGIGFALDAVAPTVPKSSASLMGGAQRALRHAIESLRWLIFDVYPPDLSGPALPHTIETLAVPLRNRGIEVSVEVEPLPELNRDILTALYRVARETLANVAEHANATLVEVTLGTRPADRPDGIPTVHLTITDNGVGIGGAAGDRRAEGHFGLQLLRDRVESLGGSWTMGPGPQGGARVEVELPLIQTQR